MYRIVVLLLAIAIMAVLVNGCTSSKPATPAPSAPAATPAMAVATAAPSTTPGCPDKYEKGVWNGNWDSRELGYASNHDVREVDWNDAGARSPSPSPRSAGM